MILRFCCTKAATTITIPRYGLLLHEGWFAIWLPGQTRVSIVFHCFCNICTQPIHTVHIQHCTLYALNTYTLDSEFYKDLRDVFFATYTSMMTPFELLQHMCSLLNHFAEDTLMLERCVSVRVYISMSDKQLLLSNK